MKKKLKKISLTNVSEKLLDSQMKHIIGGGYIGTGSGSSCYSSSGSCHSMCVFIDSFGNPHSGTCTDLGNNYCGCVSG